MYFSELPVEIKYKRIKGAHKILEKIIEKHNERIKEYGTTVDYYLGDNFLVIEKTEPEIVEEIKEWIKKNVGKYVDNILDISRILSSLDLCKHVVDFERYEKWFSMSDIYPDYFYKPKPKVYKFKKNIEKYKEIDIEEIKRIPIEDILNKLGIEYRKVGSNTIALERTDGWRANIDKNIVTDFANKGRAQGNPFSFVKKYYGFTDAETFKWFEENYF